MGQEIWPILLVVNPPDLGRAKVPCSGALLVAALADEILVGAPVTTATRLMA